jgi:hypothetical protein
MGISNPTSFYATEDKRFREVMRNGIIRETTKTTKKDKADER